MHFIFYVKLVDMFPLTDSTKNVFDVFPTTHNVKDIKPTGSLHVECCVSLVRSSIIEPHLPIFSK